MKKKAIKLTGVLVAVMMLISMLSLPSFAASDSSCGREGCNGSYKNGICSENTAHCQPAVENGVGVNGQPVYEISNAGQLFWFAALVNGNSEIAPTVERPCDANAILTADIDLNVGYTFTFIPDTGLVEIKHDGTVIAYVGVGIKGDASGTNTTFDESASLSGLLYINADDTVEDPVDLSGIREWIPIGENGLVYAGHFNGNGKTIRSVYINGSYDYRGLFGSNKGMIKNVGVVNSYIRGSYYIGGIVAYHELGDIVNCYSESIIIGNDGGSYVGGIAAYNAYGHIMNSHHVGVIGTGDRYNYIGGVVGDIYYGCVTDSYSVGMLVSGDSSGYIGGVIGNSYYTNVTNSYHTGDICVEGYCGNIGGVIGCNTNGSVTNTYNTGNISGGYENNWIGGVVGYNYYGDIENSYNKGDVSSGYGGEYIGGLVGDNSSGCISNSYNEGDVSSGENALRLGGIAGYNTTSKIINSYNVGDVSGGVYGQYIGGVAGENSYSQIIGSYNAGNVSCGDNGNSIGGVVGYDYDSEITDSYNTGNVTGGKDSSHVGGVAGNHLSGNITNSYNTGDISNPNGMSYTGGVAGGFYGGSLTKAYNEGNISGNEHVGGVAGYSNGIIKNAYNTGLVSGKKEVGGVVGYNWNYVDHTYNIGAVSGTEYVGGVIGHHEDSGYPSFNNCYLTGTAEKGVGNDIENNCLTIEISEEMLQSGALAYRFNEYIGAPVWGQNLTGDTGDAYPVFATDSNRVYYGYTSCDAEQMAPIFSNVSTATAKKPTHEMVAATCTDPSTCTACGHTEGEASGHDLAAATCTTPSTCTVCGHSVGEALGHRYDNDYDADCNVCNEARTVADSNDTDVALPGEAFSKGAVVGIVIGSVAVVGIGGFSLFWFVIKKRTWSDLVALFKR